MQEIKITFETPRGVDQINHFDLRSDFENDNCINVIFKPEGMTNAEPEEWSIECKTIDGDYLDTHKYESKEEYEHDINLLKSFAKQIVKGQTYTLADIVKNAEENSSTLKTYGLQKSGEHFLVMKNKEAQKMSFVLDYWQNKIAYYICIYSDLK